MPGLSLPKILTRRVGTSVVCDALMVVPPYPAPGASRPLGPPDGQPNTGPPTSTRRLRSARFSPGVPLGRQRSRPPVGQARVAGSGGGRREPADQGGSARVGRGRALVLCATRLGHCPGGSTGSPDGGSARVGRGRALVLCATRLGHCPGGSTGSPDRRPGGAGSLLGASADGRAGDGRAQAAGVAPALTRVGRVSAEAWAGAAPRG